MASGDTNSTVLELSRSVTDAKDVSNDNREDNNTKPKERDDTNDIENRSNDGAKETMLSAIALIQDTGGRKTLLATRIDKVMTMPRTIPIAETKMKKWTRLIITM